MSGTKRQWRRCMGRGGVGGRDGSGGPAGPRDGPPVPPPSWPLFKAVRRAAEQGVGIITVEQVRWRPATPDHRVPYAASGVGSLTSFQHVHLVRAEAGEARGVDAFAQHPANRGFEKSISELGRLYHHPSGAHGTRRLAERMKRLCLERIRKNTWRRFYLPALRCSGTEMRTESARR